MFNVARKALEIITHPEGTVFFCQAFPSRFFHKPSTETRLTRVTRLRKT